MGNRVTGCRNVTTSASDSVAGRHGERRGDGREKKETMHMMDSGLGQSKGDPRPN